MANRLKNMRLTSVDLVRNGANQEADICLFKSTDPEEDPVMPTAEEKNIFKRFINWLRENHAGEPQDDEDTVEKDYTTFNSLNAARENNEKLWQYTSALTESIRSIHMDQDLDKDQKYQLMVQSLDQFDAAMDELIEALCEAAPPAGLAKSDPEEEDVEKFNPYHDSLGRFTTGSGGGGAASGNAGSGSTRADNEPAEDEEGAKHGPLKTPVHIEMDNGHGAQREYRVVGITEIKYDGYDQKSCRAEMKYKDMWAPVKNVEIERRIRQKYDSLSPDEYKAAMQAATKKSADVDEIEEV